MIDPISVKRIQELHPKLREEALQIIGEIGCVLTGRAMFRIVSVLRSMSEQQRLYDQGRTTPGPVVTNAKPGYSLHNYGLACDGVLIIDGKTVSWDFKKDWDGDNKSDWTEVVEVFKKYGWEWGGDWKTFVDMPHFQKTFGKSIKELLALHQAGKIDAAGYVIL